MKIMYYISLLRGVNVAGQKKVPMQQLKGLYEKLGLVNVKTYIQSGNVIFESNEKDAAKLRVKIERGIKKEFGFDVFVLIRTKDDFEKIIKNNPFKDVEMLYVTLLSDVPKEVPTSEIDKYKNEADKYVVLRDLVYFSCPTGYGKTKLSNNFFEKKLNVNATTRNWNTINKLLEMCE